MFEANCHLGCSFFFFNNNFHWKLLQWYIYCRLISVVLLVWGLGNFWIIVYCYNPAPFIQRFLCTSSIYHWWLLCAIVASVFQWNIQYFISIKTFFLIKCVILLFNCWFTIKVLSHFSMVISYWRKTRTNNILSDLSHQNQLFLSKENW